MTVLSFAIWISFISFSSLIAVARTSKTMLNKSGESEYPCLIPDHGGNAFSFHCENDVCCGFVVNDLYCVEVSYLYAHFLETLS